MSASVATPMAGLPNHGSGPGNMANYTATDFTDRMELDGSSGPEDIYHNHSDDSSGSHSHSRVQIVSNKASIEEEKEALGNLLGALVPEQKEQNGENSDLPNLNDNPFPFLQEAEVDGNAQTNDQTQFSQSRLPSLDAVVANEMFSQDTFPIFGQALDISLTPNGRGLPDIDMAHVRQDSFASQGSVVRRPATPQQREFEAFARLQFEDGSYYLNTYSCELGRDVLAYRAALQKEREEQEAELNGHGKSRSSSGRASHPSGRIMRQLGSQVQGSVVSEQGGFAGIDEAPMRPPKNPDKPTMSSQESESSVVKPAEYLINPPVFDYHKSTELQAKWNAQEENDGNVPDDEQPAAVTAAHLPNPHMCPLIPIHGKPKDGQTDAELHKKISRRHVKIQWSFERDCWEMKVQGRNGAFCDDKFVRWKGVVPLHDGATIQIAHVVLTFRLPKAPQSNDEIRTPTEIDADEALPSVEARASESIVGDERRDSIVDSKTVPKINLKITQKTGSVPSESQAAPEVAESAKIPQRRGPGRPPKDGVMSTRERKERERAAKVQKYREENGGRTPPPSIMRGKLPKIIPPAILEEVKPEPKVEKRKYTKRKMVDENGNPIPDGEGDSKDGDGASDGEPKAKKARAQREKSESPEYPPREALTAEQLVRPQESYAQLLYKILLELYPRALPLKDIYRELKKRYPWFVHEATTEGWQSSVRHNLNSEYNKLFDKGDKEGKGFAWRAIPNAQLPQTEKKRTTQPAAQRPRPVPPRPSFQPGSGQNIQWQGTGGTSGPAAQQSFHVHGPWPQQGPGNNNWRPDGTAFTGTQLPPQQQLAGTSNVAAHPTSSSNTSTSAQDQAQNTPINSSRPVNGTLPLPQPPPSGHPPAGPTTVSLLPSNMPCTLEGITAITRFEGEMFKQLGIDVGPMHRRSYWKAVFHSAKRRILHGDESSIAPGGEGKEEITVMGHMRKFVSYFPNPNFKGYNSRATGAAGEASSRVSTTPNPQQAPANDESSPAPAAATAGSAVPTIANNETTTTTADASQPRRSPAQSDTTVTADVPVAEASEQHLQAPSAQRTDNADQEATTSTDT